MDIPVSTRLRLARGEMSREDVAVACDISVSALSMYENGQRVPRDEIKVKLAKFYGKSVEELFF
jgi:transcriptional regulator with XRE-family HTH domain